MKTFNDPEGFARIRRLPPSLLAVTERAREEAVARGVDVVDLSTGNPDAPAPAAVVDRLVATARDPRTHRYQDARGLPELRAAASRWYARRYGVRLDPEREILVTTGAKEGIGQALLALLAEGDTVLAPTPTYPVHTHGAALAGAESVPVSVGPGVDFFESLVAATERADARPKGLLVNFPANPTAAVATPELFEKIVRFAEARDLFILSDLAHGDLVFEGQAPSVLAAPGARERTVEFVSLARSYGMPGWRVGFCAGNAALLAALARVKSYLDHGPFGAVQAAAVTALDGCDAEVAATRERYRRRRDALVRHLGAAGWSIPPPAATMFAWAPIPEPFRSLGSLELCRRLIEEAGVAVAPGVAFGRGGEGFVRLALTVDEPRLQLAAERIAAFLKKGPGSR
jgi:alanine-synthesizing transaminase